MKALSKALVGLVLAAVVAAGGIVFWNYATLHAPVKRAMAEDSRNAKVKVWTYRNYGVDGDTLVFDLRDLDAENSTLDVMRVLFTAAGSLRDHRFEHVLLAYKGQKRFVLKGEYFFQLGMEYRASQNPVYLLRTFPENVFKMDGRQAFGTWTGGLLGVVGEQMKDLKKLHEQWYLLEWAEQQLKSGKH